MPLPFPNTTIALIIMPQLLGIVYLVVFCSLLVQVQGLYGSRGITPVAGYERYNSNCIGGDVQDLWQILARPVLSAVPYATGTPGLFLCSSSTPPWRRGPRHVRLPCCPCRAAYPAVIFTGS